MNKEYAKSLRKNIHDIKMIRVNGGRAPDHQLQWQSAMCGELEAAGEPVYIKGEFDERSYRSRLPCALPCGVCADYREVR